MSNLASQLHDENETINVNVKTRRLSVHHSSFRLHHLVFLLCLFTFNVGIAGAQQPSNDADKTREVSSSAGQITGRVVDEGGRPLSDAFVTFYKMYARTPGPPQIATSDSEGKFQSLDLAAGLYIVNVSVPGFVTANDSSESTETKYYRPGDSLSLTLIKGGVITGTVRDASGEPVVGITVRALRVRDANGRALPRIGSYTAPRITDDRGIYRIYGLYPGTYLVRTGGGLEFSSVFNAYEGDAPTFFPSSTRDTAAEVAVHSGEEVTGIDIRYRAERGHSVSGTISGLIEPNLRYSMNVTLTQSSSGAFESTTYVQPGQEKAVFSFSGVGDGEYELIAQEGLSAGDNAFSAPRHVTVKGGDVTGIELVLAPLASIAGNVFLEAEPKEPCREKRAPTFSETLISVRRDEKTPNQEATRLPFFYGNGATPAAQGEFIIRNLQAGRYRLTTRLPSNAWYIRSVVLPVAATARPTGTKSVATKSEAASNSNINLKAGEAVKGISVNIAQDAADVRGRVIAAAEGAQIPANLKIYLVPSERERAEDVLRYSEASLDSDGTFALTNLAPGRYFIIARPAPETDPTERTPRPLFWDADARTKLRREAEAANVIIELQSCQRTRDYTLRYPSSETPKKPERTSPVKGY